MLLLSQSGKANLGKYQYAIIYSAMEFFYKLNTIPHLTVNEDGSIWARSCSEDALILVKTLGLWAKTKLGFQVIAPADRAFIVQLLHEGMTSLVLGNIHSLKLPPVPVSMHELGEDSICVLGWPSPEMMIQMQQIGGIFSEKIILGGDKLMGWTFNGDLMNQLQLILSVPLTPYRGPPPRRFTQDFLASLAAPVYSSETNCYCGSRSSTIVTRSRSAALSASDPSAAR